MREKSPAVTCKNTHWSIGTQTPINTQAEDDELQLMVLFKQIGMKNYTDHCLAMHIFLGHGSHLFRLVRSRQQQHEGNKPESVFWQERRLVPAACFAWCSQGCTIVGCLCVCLLIRNETCVFKVWVWQSSGLTYILLCDHKHTHTHAYTGCKMQHM